MNESSTTPPATPCPAPFQGLEPRPIPRNGRLADGSGVALLTEWVADDIPLLVRALVDHTLQLRSQRTQQTGRHDPVPITELNRRRRSARAWLLAVLTGQADRGTLHALVTTWLPHLVGPDPDAHHARACMEFVRGAITALLFADPDDNLVPRARALHALETLLGVHLRAVQEAARARTPVHAGR